MYPDAAHKPEMAIALSAFCAFAGFLSPDHMSQMLQDYPQLNEVLGANNVLQYLDAQAKGDHRKRELVSVRKLVAAFAGAILHAANTLQVPDCVTHT
jgi:mannose-6-phosphate isomerase class I